MTSQDANKLSEDLEHFRRSINLKLLWATQGATDSGRSRLSQIIRSKFKPPDYLPASSELWTRFSNQCHKNDHRHRNNFKKREVTAWTKLKSNKAFYIIPADKGGKTVLWSREEYRREAIRQLSDKNTYLELSKQETDKKLETILKERDAITRELLRRGNINAGEADRLRKEPHELPAIYFLPKIHKAKNSDSGTYVGRPIISAFNGPLKPLDHYVAWLTKELLPAIPGSLRDTGDLLRALEGATINENSTLFSADVEALYPNIDADQGIAASTRFYAKNFHLVRNACQTAGYLDPPDPLRFRQMITLIIKNNIFHFQGEKWFHQLNGTAMGASISVYFANAFMYYKTAQLIHNPPPKLSLFVRYIDDIVGIWDGNEEEIERAFSEVVDNNIRLTFVKDKRSLAALDVLILAEDSKLATTLYRKPTDSNQFIHWSSAHPPHLKNSIPYSQLLRVRRICSKDDDYAREANLMLDRFRRRGFPEQVLEKASAAANNRSRASLLKDNCRERAENLHLVVNYHQDTSDRIRRACKAFYAELQASEYVTERQKLAKPNTRVLPMNPPVTALRVGRTLGSSLGPAYKAARNDLH